MRTLQTAMVATVILALLGGPSGAVLAQADDEAVEYAPPPSIDPSLVPDADGFVFGEFAPGVRRLVTDGADHFPSATYIREARDMDELAVDEEGRVLVWSTTHGIDNELGGDSQLWVLGEDGVLDPSEGPPRAWDEAGAWAEPMIQLAPDGSTWSLAWDYGSSGVIRSDGETDQSFLADRFLNSLAITPDGRVWVAEGHGSGEAGGIYVIEPDAVGDPVEMPAVEPTDEEVFLPGPTTTDELLAVSVTEEVFLPGPTTTDELLAVAVTEEVEPGVFRVINDGLGPLDYPVDWEVPYDIVAGHDGGIYVFEPGHYTRLGSGPYRGTHKGFDWRHQNLPTDVGVAPDGMVWAVFDAPKGGHLASVLWGSGPETRHPPTMVGPDPIEVTSDGTVWAVWRDDSGTVFGYLEADGWTVVGEWPFDAPYGGYLRVSDRGEVWAVVHGGWGFFTANRFVDGAWREEEGSRPLDSGDWGFTPPADVGVDGTFWGISEHSLVRFDGAEWTTFEPPDWSPTDDAMRALAEDGWMPEHPSRRRWGEPHVAPDGSLWVPHQLGLLDRDPDLGGGHRVVCGRGIDGVARFDGETWSRFLRGHCVEAMDIAADGSVWMLASKSDARFPLARTYVITPQAVAAQQITDFSGCVTGSQQLVKIAEGDAPMSPCGPYETEISWSAPKHAAVSSTSDDLVPGAELVTEEVEPGVLKVLSDGVRSTLGGNEDIVAGADGSIWAFKSGQFYKLGDAESHEWENDLFDTGQDSSEDIEVAPDGTLWWADRDGNGLKSFDDGTWTVRRPAPMGEQGSVDQVEVLDDGTVLASWWLGGRGDGQRKVGRLGEDGWETIHSVGGSQDAWLGANQAGEVSLMLQTAGDQPVYHGTFPMGTEGQVGRTDRPQGRIEWMDVGSDGTIWISFERGGLARHDESGWTEFDLPEGLDGLGGIQAAPDGSVWSATCGWAWGGCELLRFDGEAWSRFLGSLGLGDIDEIAFAPDGAVWSISGANDLYVVRPEAVVATE